MQTNNEEIESIILKEKNTGIYFKVLKINPNHFLLDDYLEIQKFLPAQYYIFNSRDSFFTIRDSTLDKTVCEIDKKEKEEVMLLISENGELILSKDKDFIYENYETADPFIALFSKFCSDEIPDSLIDTIDEFSKKEIWYNKYPQFIDVITSFDFAHAAEVFRKMGYKWGLGDSSRVPTLMDLKKSEYRRLIEEFFEEKCYFEKNGTYRDFTTSTGRFIIESSTYVINGKPQFRLNLFLAPVQTFC